MIKHNYLYITILSAIMLTLFAVNRLESRDAENNRANKPNFIIIFADDLGYGDLGVYGNKVHRTPNIDQMADEGVRFTDFYAAASVCTPSRASLLTGSYPKRISMDVSAKPIGTPGRQVLYPGSRKGLNPNEVTIAEVLKEKGYATAAIGKWHIGDQKPFLPTHQGFDYFYGLPYSNDLGSEICPLPLMRNENVIEAPADQKTLTKRYTQEALAFMKENKNKPFFIYLAHTAVHAPLHVSDKFRGKSKNGRYGDDVEELDWSTGKILDYLEKSGLAKNTLVIFTSDNGASRYHDGSNGPLRGFKASTWEGGFRVPAIFWWPEHILQGYTTSKLATTMDLLPTLAHLSGASLPKHNIDGHNIFQLLKDKNVNSPTEHFYYYQSDQLEAVRYKNWKLYLPLDRAYDNAYKGTFKYNQSAKLYNLKEDIGEKNNIAKEYPEIVRGILNRANKEGIEERIDMSKAHIRIVMNKMLKMSNEARVNLGYLGKEGNQVRPAGMIDYPVCVSDTTVRYNSYEK